MNGLSDGMIQCLWLPVLGDKDYMHTRQWHEPLGSTAGLIAPGTGCDRMRLQKLERLNYTADYVNLNRTWLIDHNVSFTGI